LGANYGEDTEGTAQKAANGRAVRTVAASGAGGAVKSNPARHGAYRIKCTVLYIFCLTRPCKRPAFGLQAAWAAAIH